MQEKNKYDANIYYEVENVKASIIRPKLDKDGNIIPNYWSSMYPVTYYVIGAAIRRIKPRVKIWEGLGLALLICMGLGAVSIISTDQGFSKGFTIPTVRRMGIWCCTHGPIAAPPIGLALLLAKSWVKLWCAIASAAACGKYTGSTSIGSSPGGTLWSLPEAAALLQRLQKKY